MFAPREGEARLPLASPPVLQQSLYEGTSYRCFVYPRFPRTLAPGCRRLVKLEVMAMGGYPYWSNSMN